MRDPLAIHHLDVALAAGEQPLAAFRQALRSGQDVLERRFNAGEPITELVTGRATLVDAVLRRVWAQCLPGEPTAALVAVGGYGRGDLHPGSDIDLMVLVDESVNEAPAAGLET